VRNGGSRVGVSVHDAPGGVHLEKEDGMKKWLPWLILVVAAVWVSTKVPPARDPAGGFAVQEFGRLPTVANGRFQPLDSVARNALLQLREKQSIYVPQEKRSLGATEWLMEVLMRPEKADERRTFRIDHPDLIGLLKLPTKESKPGEDGKHYTWSQIKPSLDQMEKEGKRIRDIKPELRTPYERAVMKLQSGLFLYLRLKNTLQPENTVNFVQDLAQYQKAVAPGLAALRSREAGQDYDKLAFTNLLTLVEPFDKLAQMQNQLEAPFLVPPHHPESRKDEWMRTGETLIETVRGQALHPALNYYATMAVAFRQQQPAEFNRALVEYQGFLSGKLPAETRKAKAEHYFNHLETFYTAMVLYVAAFLLACGFWFNLNEGLRRSAVWVIALAWVVHTTGLLFRMLLEGRPPVTNLYSSAVFIGWGAVVLGFVLERFFKDGIGSVVASSVGFLTLIIAHHLSLTGDTMEMMRAVLDTNFWLATHVVIVTLGYASTFVAGFLAIIYLLRGVFTTTLTATTRRSLTRMIYGILCFATLFSFVGTVLGGIWADQSWGRFWGWDPKENGALIIVLWNALILHARWGGMVTERGLANMAIAGNIVTAWSWFGVNMLGIGLHSYGFMDAAFYWLMFFVGSQLFLVFLGLLPQRLWRSFRSKGEPAPAPAQTASV
jgi:ABC-type transport system involved in cytochrome c biogenesis permease subunit